MTTTSHDIFDAGDNLGPAMAEIDPLISQLAPLVEKYPVPDILWRLAQLCRDKADQLEVDYPNAISPPAWRNAADKLQQISWDI